MKLGFKKLYCLGLALLFSFNAGNVSFGAKAAESSTRVEKRSFSTQSDARDTFVVTKEMLQTIVDQQMKNAKSKKSAMATFILAFFGGEFGLHRFYVGKWGTGILYLFTGGLFGIGWFVDVIRIALEDFEDCKHLPIKF